MRSIELKTKAGVLLLGSPNALDQNLVRRFGRRDAVALIDALKADKTAVDRLRASWHSIAPAGRAAARRSQDFICQVESEIKAGRIAAFFLPNGAREVAGTKIAIAPGAIVHVVLPSATILVGSAGTLPPRFARAMDRARAARALVALGSNDESAMTFERYAHRLPETATMVMTGDQLRRHVAFLLERNMLDGAVLSSAGDRNAAAMRADAPVAVRDLAAPEKIYFALLLSRGFVTRDLAALIDGLLDWEVVGKFAAVTLAFIALQTIPGLDLVVDLYLAYELLKALGTSGIAFAKALGAGAGACASATTEADLRVAAREFANAFEAAGVAGLSWLLLRLQVKRIDAKLEKIEVSAGGSTAGRAKSSKAEISESAEVQKSRTSEKVETAKVATTQVLSKAEAEAFLVKSGVPENTARSYVESFEGPITLRPVKGGETFLRYGDDPAGKGSFLTRTKYATPEEAVEGLYLGPYGNKAQYVQEVTASKDTFVLEGGVKNGNPPGAIQSVITDRSAFTFGSGSALK